MNETLLSWYQALQLLALGPCLFMIFFLCAAVRDFRQTLVPVVYFACLACSFILPLRELFGLSDTVHALLSVAASAGPVVSFLLIVQFVSSRTPPLVYWLILAVPVVGGSQLVYASVVTQGEVCVYEHFCMQPEVFRKLYNVFSISLVMLLSLYIYRKLERPADAAAPRMQEKRALVQALVALNLLLLAADLLQMAGYADMEHARLAKTVVRIGFIYVVLTLMFRAFDHPVAIAYDRVPSIRPPEPNTRDLQLAQRIRAAFSEENLHRDMDLSREKLARKLAVTEAALSRVVNQCFGESVSMLVNRRRVEEAQKRLCEENTAITAIAFEVGFSSIPSFNRVFRQISGMSPSEYRSNKPGP